MLAKKVRKNGKDWDKPLPYVLFAYHLSAQESTSESSFFLMYSGHPVLLTTDMHVYPPRWKNINNYKLDDSLHVRCMTTGK